MSKWGWYEWQGPGYSFDPPNDTNFRKTTTIDNTKWYIKFGNDFGDDWIDHKTVKNFYFYDNPELPHLLYPNPANPKGAKDWIRLVPNEILTQPKSGSGTERINRLLSEHSGTSMVWQDLVYPHDVLWSNSNRVLVCPSSANCYHYYYNDDVNIWIKKTCDDLRRLGYEPVVRTKPSRTLRRDKPLSRLGRELAQGDYLCTVSQHSVTALETILEGYPAVVTGVHGAGFLATPWEEFEQGEIRLPMTIEIESWMDTVLSNCRHKSEMKEGTWHD